MVEIGPYPILWHIMKTYSCFGHRRFILCLGYKSWEIKRYFIHYKEILRDYELRLADSHNPHFLSEGIGDEDWSVVFAETGAEAGTGARLKRVEQYLDCDRLCFTYGDAVGQVDIAALIDFHVENGRRATVTGVRPTSRYGEMNIDGSRVTEFREKPTAEGVVSGGFFVLERSVVEDLGTEPDLFFEDRPLQQLAREDDLSVFLHEGFWHPMDTYRDYLALNDIWSRGRAPWKIW